MTGLPSKGRSRRGSRVISRWGSAIGVSVLAVGLLVSCGEAAEASPPLTIGECEELGGTPLFDPEDERPIELSCPDGLHFLGEFEEPFFGVEGGICCGGPEGEVSVALTRE